jgi:Tat protein translocase TatB subunit
MGSFTFSEILMILVVILVVFGPKRLPELARRAGELVAKTRDATRSVTEALDREYGEQAQPFRDLKAQVDGVRDDLRNATGSITNIGAGSVDSRQAESAEADVDGGDDPAA